MRDEIENALGRKLSWHNPENKRSCRLYTRKVVNLDDQTRWPEYLEWLANELNDFHRVFGPIVRNVEP
jgi:hypothetical protein